MDFDTSISTAMYLLLRLTILGILCLHAHGWVLKSSSQNKPWKALDQLQNRELFLSALQSYFNGKGIHVDRTAPDFALAVIEQDVEFHGVQEGQARVTLEPRMKE
uniref:Uncharacterized protein n=1 Tax=Sphaerodactylus townsendi TaxID=933632 RepID=A0ACB8EVH0_9SAUR